MARSWVTDLWVKDAIVTLPDGTTSRLSPTGAQLKAIKSLPSHFRTSKFGVGRRWGVSWYELTDKGQRQRSRTFERRADAEAFQASMEDDIRSDRYIDPSERERSFGDVAKAWLASKNRIKDSSWRRYDRELRNYVLPQWRHTPIGSITRPQIDAWVSLLREGNAPFEFATSDTTDKRKNRTPKKPKASYLAHMVSATFGGVIRYALETNIIGQNPLARVELPRDDGDLEDDLPSLSYAKIEKLAQAAVDLTGRSVDRVLLELLAYSGPRIGEATAFKIKDVDLSNERIRIHRTWTTDREGRRKLGPVKNWEKRWLPVPKFLVAELKKLIANRSDDDYLFTTVRGAAIDGSNWYNRVWQKVKKISGIGGTMSVHDLRHVAATNAIAAGADVKVVQTMLGHKDATETLNTYSHLWPDRVAEVMRVVELRRAEELALAA